MSDTLIKFGGECSATSCGSKNPIVTAMAMAILEGMNDRSLSVSKAHEAQAQNIGNAMASSGIALG
ncbi:MAG: hypothetical protein ACOYNL_02080 [Rickettsiales bacterium]